MDYEKEQLQLAIAKLRVNVKSLAAESRIIRRECSRNRATAVKDSLTLHRKLVVRSEARSAQLALACLRGREYQAVEKNAKNEPDWDRITKKIDKATWSRKIRMEAASTLREWRKRYQKKMPRAA